MENNNVENRINEIYDDIAAEVTEKVKTDLAGKVTVIPTGYSPERDAVSIIQEYNEAKDRIEKEMKYNEDTYKDSVVKIRNADLRYDLQDLQETTVKRLADVTVKAEKDYADKIEKLQKSDAYKDSKAECFQILGLLKDSDIPVEKVLEFISPLIETHDVKSLEVCEILLAKNATAKYAIGAAKDEIRAASEHVELNTMLDTMCRHVTEGYDGLDYFNYIYMYSKDQEM